MKAELYTAAAPLTSTFISITALLITTFYVKKLDVISFYNTCMLLISSHVFCAKLYCLKMAILAKKCKTL